MDRTAEEELREEVSSVSGLCTLFSYYRVFYPEIKMTVLLRDGENNGNMAEIPSGLPDL